jgi:CO dehydrogenase maturation factor
MKLAITGKGGVGKTTLAGLLARAYAAEGRRVLAIDADPDANLASALGVAPDLAAALQPISKMKQLAKERTGADNSFGSLFILNPKVDDLPDKFCVHHAGVRLLVMGTVDHGGGGCVCPEHTLVRRLLKHLLLEDGDVVILDMEAGIEHLGRATAESVDLLLIVVEPGQRSLQTALQIERLAADIGIDRIAYVASKVDSPDDRAFLECALPSGRFLGTLSLHEDIRSADRLGIAPYDLGGQVVAETQLIMDNLAAFARETTPCAR